MRVRTEIGRKGEPVQIFTPENEADLDLLEAMADAKTLDNRASLGDKVGEIERKHV